MSNFQIPSPCQNCLRFHYGYCRESAKQCWRCGYFNHIERYCPQRRIRWPRGDMLPGSRRWCEYFGLDTDPDLRFRVLNSLKLSPICNIWVNGDCIYRGCIEYHFQRNEMRGRPLGERISRRRSRSPIRDRVQNQRSRSPLRRRSPPPMDNHIRPQRRDRSRSPLQQRRSPPHTPPRPRGRSPVFSGSKVMSFGANVPRGMDKMFQTKFRVQELATTLQDKPKPNSLQGTGLFRSHFLGQTFPVTSQQVTQIDKVPQTTESIATSRAIGFEPLEKRNLIQVSTTIIPDDNNQVPTTLTQTAVTVVTQKDGVPELIIDDPHFVLGVSKEALEPEIIEAYQKLMWDVEVERVADAGYELVPNKVWDESVAILRAAKKKLVGY